ncbi:hypothetical protein CRG98_042758 [Punica granatum]|uniref:Uncharacterized protein n=1 Tax=Punica granatum TaxID=22663 RepID=A0A2I0HYN2_PUNGR|nr:hypothetical protein CRG98_042758 [Punica granatum]
MGREGAQFIELRRRAVVWAGGDYGPGLGLGLGPYSGEHFPKWATAVFASDSLLEGLVCLLIGVVDSGRDRPDAGSDVLLFHKINQQLRAIILLFQLVVIVTLGSTRAHFVCPHKEIFNLVWCEFTRKHHGGLPVKYQALHLNITSSNLTEDVELATMWVYYGMAVVGL